MPSRTNANWLSGDASLYSILVVTRPSVASLTHFPHVGHTTEFMGWVGGAQLEILRTVSAPEGVAARAPARQAVSTVAIRFSMVVSLFVSRVGQERARNFDRPNLIPDFSPRSRPASRPRGGRLNGLDPAQSQAASGGRDIRMASILPPVIRPKRVPRSWSRLNST